MRKRTVRRVWNTEVNPIEYAMAGASVTPRHILDKLLAKELAALEAFRFGKAQFQDYITIQDLNNLTQTMAEMGIGPEAMEPAMRVEEALIECAERFERTQRLGMTGPDLTAIHEVIEYHDLQRSSVDRSTYEKAIRLRKAHTQNGYKTTDVNEHLQRRKLEAQKREPV